MGRQNFTMHEADPHGKLSRDLPGFQDIVGQKSFILEGSGLNSKDDLNELHSENVDKLQVM